MALTGLAGTGPASTGPASTGGPDPAGERSHHVVVAPVGLVITTATGAGGHRTWLRLAGEADLSDCGALRQALAGPVSAPGDVHLDLAALAFADVAVTRVLAQTAASLAPERNLVLHRASRSLLRLMRLCWPAQAGLEVTAELAVTAGQQVTAAPPASGRRCIRQESQMSVLAASIHLSLPASPFPPLAVGFMGLGTGYLIYGVQELFGYPKRDERADVAAGIWGLWMPGFMQFIAGVYLFAGLTLFGTFTAAPLYMAALAFTAFGVHWFALGWIRMRRADTRTNIGMTVAFLALSVLGIIVFFKAGDHPVGGAFIGLACVYVAEFFATLAPDLPVFRPAERVLGFFRLGTGLWLMYLVYAVALDFVLKYTLPV